MVFAMDRAVFSSVMFGVGVGSLLFGVFCQLIDGSGGWWLMLGLPLAVAGWSVRVR
jgi:hypothetical protein